MFYETLCFDNGFLSQFFTQAVTLMFISSLILSCSEFAAQLAEWLLPISEIRGSQPRIGKKLFESISPITIKERRKHRGRDWVDQKNFFLRMYLFSTNQVWLIPHEQLELNPPWISWSWAHQLTKSPTLQHLLNQVHFSSNFFDCLSRDGKKHAFVFFSARLKLASKNMKLLLETEASLHLNNHLRFRYLKLDCFPD